MNLLPASEAIPRNFAFLAVPLVLVFATPMVTVAQQFPMQSEDCDLHTPGRCAAVIAKDQIGILSSPFHMKKKDLKWFLPFAAATVTSFGFDRKALHEIGTDPSQVNAFRTASNITGIYVPVAGVGASWLIGQFTHNDHLQETGLLAGEALADAAIVTEMMKFATNRVRPDGTGLPLESAEFWPEGKSYPAGDSFPSGHTAIAFAFAHVVADEYPSWEVKLAAYSLAAATGFERLGGREHFPSDVLVGGTVGYLIGGYVYNHHSKASKSHLTVVPLVGGKTVGASLSIH